MRVPDGAIGAGRPSWPAGKVKPVAVAAGSRGVPALAEIVFGGIVGDSPHDTQRAASSEFCALQLRQTITAGECTAVRRYLARCTHQARTGFSRFLNVRSPETSHSNTCFTSSWVLSP